MVIEHDLIKSVGLLIVLIFIIFYTFLLAIESILMWIDGYMWKHYRKDLNLRQSLTSRRGEEFLNLLESNEISIHNILKDSDYCENIIIKTSKVQSDIELGKLTKEKYK